MRRRDFGQVYEKAGRPGFYVRLRWRGLSLKRHAGPSRENATSKLAKLHVKLENGVPFDDAVAEVFGGGKANRLSFRDASALFMQYREGRVKESTFHGDKGRFQLLNSSPWASKSLPDLRPVDFMRWTEDRRRKVSGATINRDLALASALFRWAEKMGYAKENPLRRVEKFSERGRARETYLTAEESRALVDAANPIMRPVLAAALSTGARRGELLRLCWRDVDFDRKEIIIRAENEKSGRGRVVPLTVDLLAELLALRKGRTVKALEGNDPVFLQANGAALTGEVLRKGLPAALRACTAIPAEKKPKVCFHSLRHSCASMMVAAGVPLFDVAKILGHSTLAVTMRYSHFAPESGRSAVEKLGKALGLSGSPAVESGASAL
ncbi:MAG: phage integrase family site specific [Planctomycetota bacterium]|nr:MAG: phage integrase family site specific [Planctomycetota bacterium]